MKFSSLFSGWLGGVLGALALVLVGVVGWWILSPPKGETPLEANAPAEMAPAQTAPAQTAPAQTTAPETSPEAAPTSTAQALAPTDTTEAQAEVPTAQTAPLLPSFDVVRVEPNGSALVAGRAEPGAEVSVLVDGRTVASTKADPGAGFVAVFDLATSPNDRVMTLETELADGTKLASEVSVIVEGVEPPRVLAQADTGVTEPATAEASPAATPPQPEPSPAAENAPDTAQDTAPDAAPGTTTALSPSEPQTAAPDAPAPDAVAPATATAEPAPQMAPQTAPESTADSAAPAQPQTATAAPVEPAPAEPTTGASEPTAEQAPGDSERARPEATQPEAAQAESPTPTPEPQAPRLLLAGPDGLRVLQDSGAVPQLSVDAITYDAAGEVGISGRGQADETLHVYVDNTPVTTAEVAESGAWQVPLPDVGTGIHTLRVDSVVADGSVVRRVETPFHREDKDVLTAASSEAAATGQPLAAITVQPGNTLWAIAEGRYGEGIKYWTIFDANRDQIRDPHWIYPGQVFALPQENP